MENRTKFGSLKDAFWSSRSFQVCRISYNNLPPIYIKTCRLCNTGRLQLSRTISLIHVRLINYPWNTLQGEIKELSQYSFSSTVYTRRACENNLCKASTTDRRIIHISPRCIRDAIKSTSSKGGFRVSRQGRLTHLPFPPHSPLPLTIRYEMLF